MLYPEQHLRNFQFFTNQVIWPRTWDGVTLLRAAEVDIATLEGGFFGQDIISTDNITTDRCTRGESLFHRVTKGLDYLVASVHDRSFAQSASIAQTTEMYLRVLAKPRVFVLGHTGRAGVPFDLDEVLTAAKERGKLIEINEHSLEGDRTGGTVDTCRRIAERCAELGVGISVSSDARPVPHHEAHARGDSLPAGAHHEPRPRHDARGARERGRLRPALPRRRGVRAGGGRSGRAGRGRPCVTRAA